MMLLVKNGLRLVLPSTIFILTNGEKRSPDAAWVKLSRYWEAQTAKILDRGISYLF